MDIQIHFHSSERLSELENDSVDLIVTSPPYKEDDGFSYDMMKRVFIECGRVLKNNSLIFVNFGHLAGKKARPYKIALMAEYLGFEWIDTIVWTKYQEGKGHFSPIQGDKRLNNVWEPLFLFATGEKYSLDRDAIGEPYTYKRNIERFRNRGVDLRCPGNVWFVPYETITDKSQKRHKDRFPMELPRRCIKMAGLEKGSVVLDPFCGSGTTLEAARELGMNAIGYEINEDCIDRLLLFRADPTRAIPWL